MGSEMCIRDSNFRIARKHFLVETKDKAEKGKAASNDYTILDGKEWNIKDYSIDGKGENKGGKSDTNTPFHVPGLNMVLRRK